MLTPPFDKVYIAFYRGRTNLFGDLIKFWTRSKYAHVEIWYAGGTRCGVSYKNGVVVYKGDGLRHQEDSWDLVPVSCSPGAFQRIGKFIAETVGQGYDWRGIVFSQAFGGRIGDRLKWFCSEHVHEALQLGVSTDPSVGFRDSVGVSPEKLYYMLTGAHSIPPSRQPIIMLAVAVAIVGAVLLALFR